MYTEGNLYYYTTIDKRMGMKSSGSFTKDRSQWMAFTSLEARRYDQQGLKPYGATHRGQFVKAE